MIISIIEEEAVIQKRLKLVEELHITSSEVETTTSTEVNLKKERIIIERDPGPPNK
jgi:stress response protein YsnF